VESSTREPSRRIDATAARAAAAPRGKLSFKEQRELSALPAELEGLEREQHALTERMSSPDYYKHGAQAMKGDRTRAQEIEQALATKLERWVELDERSQLAK
jgi:ATP-binding cassette subfamily F protein uup